MLGEGRLLSTRDAASPIARPDDREAYVFGAVRDVTGDAPPYSYFALRRGSGEVWLLDAGDPTLDRFVSSSLATFLASMNAFHTAWPQLAYGSDEVVASFRALLAKLDARALDDPENYWPGWLEELE
jgi:hypothetical protein